MASYADRHKTFPPVSKRINRGANSGWSTIWAIHAEPRRLTTRREATFHPQVRPLNPYSIWIVKLQIRGQAASLNAVQWRKKARHLAGFNPAANRIFFLTSAL